MRTFIEGVETDDFNFEVSVEGHLPEDVVAESCLTSSTASCHSDDNLLVWLLNQTFLAGDQSISHPL